MSLDAELIINALRNHFTDLDAKMDRLFRAQDAKWNRRFTSSVDAVPVKEAVSELPAAAAATTFSSAAASTTTSTHIDPVAPGAKEAVDFNSPSRCSTVCRSADARELVPVSTAAATMVTFSDTVSTEIAGPNISTHGEFIVGGLGVARPRRAPPRKPRPRQPRRVPPRPHQLRHLRRGRLRVPRLRRPRRAPLRPPRLRRPRRAPLRVPQLRRPRRAPLCLPHPRRPRRAPQCVPRPRRLRQAPPRLIRQLRRRPPRLDMLAMTALGVDIWPAALTCSPAPAAQCAEDVISAKWPTRCSTYCLSQIHKHAKPLPIATMAVASKSSSNGTAVHVVFDVIQQRYIIKPTPAYLISVVLPCVATKVRGAQKEFLGMDSQNVVFLQPLLVELVDKRPWPPPLQYFQTLGTDTNQSYLRSWQKVSCGQFYVQQKLLWPPPIHLEMESIGALVRPTPWPSFNGQTAVMHMGKSLPREECSSVSKPMVIIFFCDISGVCLQYWFGLYGTAVQSDGLQLWPIPWLSFCVSIAVQASLSMVMSHSANRCLIRLLNSTFSLEHWRKWLEFLDHAAQYLESVYMGSPEKAYLVRIASSISFPGSNIGKLAWLKAVQQNNQLFRIGATLCVTQGTLDRDTVIFLSKVIQLYFSFWLSFSSDWITVQQSPPWQFEMQVDGITWKDSILSQFIAGPYVHLQKVAEYFSTFPDSASFAALPSYFVECYWMQWEIPWLLATIVCWFGYELSIMINLQILLLSSDHSWLHPQRVFLHTRHMILRLSFEHMLDFSTQWIGCSSIQEKQCWICNARILSSTLIQCYESDVQLPKCGDYEASSITGFYIILPPLCSCFMVTQLPMVTGIAVLVPQNFSVLLVDQRLYPLPIVEFLFRLAASFVEIKIKDVTSIKYLQVPWDPGGIDLMHRLEGKPNLKKGGMSGICLWIGGHMGSSCQPLETGYQKWIKSLQLYLGRAQARCQQVPACTYLGLAHCNSLYSVPI